MFVLIPFLYTTNFCISSIESPLQIHTNPMVKAYILYESVTKEHI